MDSDDEFIYNELCDSLSSDDSDGEYKLMTMIILEEMEKEGEHGINFRGFDTGQDNCSLGYCSWTRKYLGS